MGSARFRAGPGRLSGHRECELLPERGSCPGAAFAGGGGEFGAGVHLDRRTDF